MLFMLTLRSRNISNGLCCCSHSLLILTWDHFHTSSQSLIISQHALGDFDQLNGLYLLVVEEVRNQCHHHPYPHDHISLSQEDRPHPVCVDGCVYTKQGENTGDEYCFRYFCFFYNHTNALSFVLCVKYTLTLI